MNKSFLALICLILSSCSPAGHRFWPWDPDNSPDYSAWYMAQRDRFEKPTLEFTQVPDVETTNPEYQIKFNATTVNSQTSEVKCKVNDKEWEDCHLLSLAGFADTVGSQNIQVKLIDTKNREVSLQYNWRVNLPVPSSNDPDPSSTEPSFTEENPENNNQPMTPNSEDNGLIPPESNFSQEPPVSPSIPEENSPEPEPNPSSTPVPTSTPIPLENNLPESTSPSATPTPVVSNPTPAPTPVITNPAPTPVPVPTPVDSSSSNGSFKVLGITGGSDTKQDNKLQGAHVPTIWWKAPGNISFYTISIYDKTGKIQMYSTYITTSSNHYNTVLMYLALGQYQLKIIGYASNGKILTDDMGITVE